MSARTAIVGLVLTLLAAPATATTVSSQARSALRAFEDPSLEIQRGGAVVARASLGEAERSALRSAEAANRELAEMRAGDIHLNDRDLTIIAIVAAVILIIVIVA